MQPLAVKVRSPLTAAAAIAVAALTATAPAFSQNFPSAGVKLIVPVPAGGVTDTMARLVAQHLTEMWGQPVVVDNRPGGNTGVGAQAVSGAPPDGHTLLVAPDSTFTANPALFSRLTYDPGDFTPIIVLCRASPVLVARR
jgi:tripartite-type tricarboxylate transporter receptor subunit TctC